MNHSTRFAALGLMSLALVSLSHSKSKGEHPMPNDQGQSAKEATFVHMKAATGKEGALKDLLTTSAEVVRRNEPHTLQWFGLQENPSSFAIIDFFPDPKGRDAHFGGKVASALNKSAAESIEGGWDKGVVANVNNSQILSYTVTQDRSTSPKIAVRVAFTAKAGKEAEVAKFLAGAAQMVRDNEPATLVFYTMRTGPSQFAIFDAFSAESGMGAHFAGKVAAGLKANAPEWFEGGWEKGVLTGVKNYTVLSSTY